LKLKFNNYEKHKINRYSIFNWYACYRLSFYTGKAEAGAGPAETTAGTT
jgi:hypothetical protein